MKATTSWFNLWLWAAVFAAFTTYTIPWVVSRDSGLTFNGYDLAEWASLHPEVRATPVLITSLLLRLQGTWIAVIIAVNTLPSNLTRGWWMSVIFLALIAIALLPPLEFFFEARGDGNYQQQFGIAIITLIAGILGISGILDSWRWVITIAAAAMGVTSSLVGLTQGMSLLEKFGVNPQLGAGGLLMVTIYILVVIMVFYHVGKSKQGGTSLRAALLKAT